MLVDWRATTLLIRSDQPLVSPRKVVIGEFAPMDPPRIAVGAEAEEPIFGIATECEVDGGGGHDILSSLAGRFKSGFSLGIGLPPKSALPSNRLP